MKLQQLKNHLLKTIQSNTLTGDETKAHLREIIERDKLTEDDIQYFIAWLRVAVIPRQAAAADDKERQIVRKK
jgi:hypothetical protein